MIPKRPLGKTGIDVSCLSLGTVKFGRNQGVKYPSGFELPEDSDIVGLLDQCREAGINLLDTAPAYGISEERLGQLLPGSRQDWLLSTKAGENFVDGQSHYDFSRSAIETSVRQSLKNLQTDYLDLVLIHSDGNDLNILEQTDAMSALQALKEKGDIRWIGISTKTVAGGLKALDVSDVLMVTLNPSDTSQVPVIEAAETSGCGILIKKAMDSGHGDAAASLRLVLDQPGVTSVVTGTINPQHLQANIEVASKI